MKTPRTLLTVVVTALLLIGALPALADDPVVVEGGGWGHGIGMSQYGARAMAEDGATAVDILTYFYTGVEPGTVGEGELVGHAEPLRIGVAQNLDKVSFYAENGDLNVCLGADCFVASPDQAWELISDGAGGCRLEKDGAEMATSSSCEGEITWESQPDIRVVFPDFNRTYARGRVIFAPSPLEYTIHVIVELPLEEYLYGLAEMPSSWPEEALKAQAIAGRTYALYKARIYSDLESNQARMDACGCHLYASTLDQKYTGWAKEGETENDVVWGDLWVAAVDATAGQALYHPDDGVDGAIEAYYFSSTGGATENNEDKWGGTPYSYLRSKPDPGATSWTASIDRAHFAADLGFDEVTWVEISEVYESGSPKVIVVQGEKDGTRLEKTYTGTQFASKLGLRSHYVKTVLGFVAPDADLPVLHDPDTGIWTYKQADGDLTSIYYGNPGDYAFFGDWDCDGVDTPGLYRQSDGYVYLRNSNSQGVADIAFFFGNPGDVPIAGDFDGDGCDTVSIYRPDEARFYIINTLGSEDKGLGQADYAFYYGEVGDTPFVGDWDGDGIDTVGLHRDSDSFVYLRNSNSEGVADIEFFYGDPGDLIFVGDWDGDGIDTVGIYRPSEGMVYLRNSNSSGAADFSYEMGGGSLRPVAGAH